MLRDKVLIRPAKKAKISELILLPDDTQIKPQAYGLVIACGPGCTEVRPGELVHFERFDWNVAPEDCIVIAEGEILAKEN